jgi:hypothetical protein
MPAYDNQVQPMASPASVPPRFNNGHWGNGQRNVGQPISRNPISVPQNQSSDPQQIMQYFQHIRLSTITLD